MHAHMCACAHTHTFTHTHTHTHTHMHAQLSTYARTWLYECCQGSTGNFCTLLHFPIAMGLHMRVGCALSELDIHCCFSPVTHLARLGQRQYMVPHWALWVLPLSSRAFGLTTIWYRHCVDRWNIWWFESESSFQVNVICLIWLQPMCLISMTNAITYREGFVHNLSLCCYKANTLWFFCAEYYLLHPDWLKLLGWLAGQNPLFWLAEAAQVIGRTKPSVLIGWSCSGDWQDKTLCFNVYV